MPKEQLSAYDPALDGLYRVLQLMHAANHILRFGKSNYLHVAQQEQMDQFVNIHGHFESVSGHTMVLINSALLLKRIFPHINKALNWELVYEIASVHDVRELQESEISAAMQAVDGYDHTSKKQRETEFMKQLTGNLPDNVAEEIFKMAEDYEFYGDDSLEMRFVRFLDDWQAGPFVLQFKSTFEGYEELQNKITRARLAKWAKELKDAFEEKGHKEAAKEIDVLMVYHIKRFKEAGLDLNLEEYSL